MRPVARALSTKYFKPASDDFSSFLLKDAKMLITISGTSAFEAILRKIPVIHFGDLPFEILIPLFLDKPAPSSL